MWLKPFSIYGFKSILEVFALAEESGGVVREDCHSVTQQQHSRDLWAADERELMFELKPAIVYHLWHFSPVQTG